MNSRVLFAVFPYRNSHPEVLRELRASKADPKTLEEACQLVADMVDRPMGDVRQRALTLISQYVRKRLSKDRAADVMRWIAQIDPRLAVWVILKTFGRPDRRAYGTMDIAYANKALLMLSKWLRGKEVRLSDSKYLQSLLVEEGATRRRDITNTLKPWEVALNVPNGTANSLDWLAIGNHIDWKRNPRGNDKRAISVAIEAIARAIPTLPPEAQR